MRIEPALVEADAWLEGLCRQILEAGEQLTTTVGEINERTEQAGTGLLGRRRRITEVHLRAVGGSCKSLHDVQVAVQDALFDCEHELRALREREVSPAELLVDGERLICQYRFLRRRARVIDGLLAYLPVVTSHAVVCLEHLHRLHEGDDLNGALRVPDCGFALAALEELQDDEPAAR